MHFQGETEVVVLIKAAPEMGKKHGETVCVAGVDRDGKWHRLYPVPFRDLTDEQRFKRWDIVRVRWRRPDTDQRIESKRIDASSLRIVGAIVGDERHRIVSRAIVDSLEREEHEGRSLALIRPTNVSFHISKLSPQELHKSQRRRDELLSQLDLFGTDHVLSSEAPPYSFRYQFDHGDRKKRRHLCIDWETEATFFKWRHLYGEEETLKKMVWKWGHEMPDSGLVFAMGTHRVSFWRKWLLSGVIQSPAVPQMELAL